MSQQMEATGESIPLTVHLDPRVIEWIDRINVDLGLRSRSAIIVRLLTELSGVDGQDPSAISDDGPWEHPAA